MLTTGNALIGLNRLNEELVPVFILHFATRFNRRLFGDGGFEFQIYEVCLN